MLSIFSHPSTIGHDAFFHRSALQGGHTDCSENLRRGVTPLFCEVDASARI